jgi:hypothetical protein
VSGGNRPCRCDASPTALSGLKRLSLRCMTSDLPHSSYTRSQIKRWPDTGLYPLWSPSYHSTYSEGMPTLWRKMLNIPPFWRVMRHPTRWSLWHSFVIQEFTSLHNWFRFILQSDSVLSSVKSFGGPYTPCFIRLLKAGLHGASKEARQVNKYLAPSQFLRVDINLPKFWGKASNKQVNWQVIRQGNE